MYVKSSDLDTPERRATLVENMVSEIGQAKNYWNDDFDRMREDQEIARTGGHEDWEMELYTVNVTQRYIRQKTATLYAKNPRAIYQRKPRMDFTIWNGTQAEIEQAMMGLEQAMMMGMPPDPAAVALLQDVQQGVEHRKMLDRIGKTLTHLYQYYVDESDPSFKDRMKAMVRNTITTGVGYVKIGFHRLTDKAPETMQRIAAIEKRLNHVKMRAQQLADGDKSVDDPEAEELQLTLNALQQEPDIIVREGLVWDFPDSTSIIPSPNCLSLKGFIGCDWVAEEFFFTPDEIRAQYGIDLDQKDFKPYSPGQDTRMRNVEESDELVAMYEVYHETTGLRFLLIDGFDDFVEEPGPPPVELEQFWPWFTYSYNELPHQRSPYPLSDTRLMLDMQMEMNRSREAMREHRVANRPAYATPENMLDDEDKDNLRERPAHAIVELKGLVAGQTIDQVLQPIKQHGIDPNMYDTSPYFNDIQMVVGAQEANFASISGATATETSIAEAARTAATESEADELNQLLSAMARAGGQILLLNVGAETVTRLVGPGAVWPEFSIRDTQEEIYLEVVAGSNGRPNRAQRAQSLQQLAPLMLQIPGIRPEWLARQLVQSLDEGIELEEAFLEGLPSIIMQNSQAMAQTIGSGGQGGGEGQSMQEGEAENPPAQQGAQGSSNAPRQGVSGNPGRAPVAPVQNYG